MRFSGIELSFQLETHNFLVKRQDFFNTFPSPKNIRTAWSIWKQMVTAPKKIKKSKNVRMFI